MLTLKDFSIGDRVRIVAVAHPELPHHALFVGRTGAVKRVIKSRDVVEVLLDARGNESRLRDCYPHNLAKEIKSETVKDGCVVPF